MAAALKFLLIGLLLPGGLCQEFQIIMPQSIKALSGSCVTIPCSFKVAMRYEPNLKTTCKAIWKNDKYKNVVFDSSDQNRINGELRGNLTEKDCTTTLNKMAPGDQNKYYLRLECLDSLKYDYGADLVEILVKDDPPRPTLTPSSLQVKEGTSVSLTCSAPAPCLSHPPTLTWTPSLGHSQETLQENQDKAKVKISVMTFTVSRHHHRQKISCTAVYNKLDGSAESATTGILSLNITFAPQILPSSLCIETVDQLNCSCETVGNPPPALQWYLNGLPVNHSDKFSYSSEPPDDAGLSSIITVNQTQWRDLPTLLCHSSNSLGSATQRFYISSLVPLSSAGNHECSCHVALPVFIVTVSVFSAALVCALMFAVGALSKGCKKHTKSHCTSDTTAHVMSGGLTNEKGNKVSITSEEDIYVNTNIIKSSGPETQRGPQHVCKSTKKKNEEGSGVIYSDVTWKNKKKKKKRDHSRGRNLSGSSCLEEERCMEGGMCRNFASNALEMESLYGNIANGKDAKKAVPLEYAQVTFRDKNMMYK